MHIARINIKYPTGTILAPKAPHAMVVFILHNVSRCIACSTCEPVHLRSYIVTVGHVSCTVSEWFGTNVISVETTGSELEPDPDHHSLVDSDAETECVEGSYMYVLTCSAAMKFGFADVSLCHLPVKMLYMKYIYLNSNTSFPSKNPHCGLSGYLNACTYISLVQFVSFIVLKVL